MNKSVCAPLSKTQIGVYMDGMAVPESTLYNIPLLGKLGVEIDVDRLKDAICKAVKAHPGLNTRIFFDENGNVMQQICEDECCVDVVELSDEQFAAKKEQLVRPFNLLNSRLYRFEIYKTPLGNYFFQDIHHIIFDGMGLGILAKDIRKAYDGEPLRPETYTGIDVALDEMCLRESEAYTSAREYYGRLLDGRDAECLPVRDVYENEPRQGWITHEFSVDEAVFKALRKEGVSTTAFFTSVMGFLMAKYNYRSDSVIATIYNGRKNEKTDSTTVPSAFPNSI